MIGRGVGFPVWLVMFAVLRTAVDSETFLPMNLMIVRYLTPLTLQRRESKLPTPRDLTRTVTLDMIIAIIDTIA